MIVRNSASSVCLANVVQANKIRYPTLKNSKNLLKTQNFFSTVSTTNSPFSGLNEHHISSNTNPDKFVSY